MHVAPMSISQRWVEARRHEERGDAASALRSYRALLKVDPFQGAAWLRIAAIEQNADDYGAALTAVMEAKSAITARNDWKLLPYLSQRLLAFDQHGAVSDVIGSADWSHPDVLAQSAVLSQHLWLVEDFDCALRLINHVIPRARPSHLLHYSRANALRFCGRMDEATAEYEQAVALAPDYAFAHWSLASHRKASPAMARLGRIRLAIDRTVHGTPQYAHLQYALFRELDSAGDAAHAWTALEEGANVARKAIHHDTARERLGLSALQKTIDRNFLASRPTVIPGEHVPIFVVGMPRTGTTVLERILGNHSAVSSGGELNDFHSALCLASNRFVGDALDETTVDLLAPIDFANVGRSYLDRTRGRVGASGYLVDKNPINIFNAGYIAKALPSAKIVCLHRNPMDACFSNLKELFSGNAYAYSYDLVELASHYLTFRSICTHWQEMLGDQFMMVDYEKLVTAPNEVTTQVMNFCGLPFEADCIDLARNTTPVSTASSSQVREPVHAKGIGGWHPYAIALSPVRAIIEEALPGLRAEDVRAPAMLA